MRIHISQGYEHSPLHMSYGLVYIVHYLVGCEGACSLSGALCSNWAQNLGR